MAQLPVPFLYLDESIYSLAGRYRDRTLYYRKREVVEDLFGNSNVIATPNLPSHLDYFFSIAAVPRNFTVDDLIEQHTALPYHRPFLPSARWMAIRTAMVGAGGPAIHMLSGLMASRIPIVHQLRLCHECVQEDRDQFGETYWHRVHQLPGVMVCPIHEQPLKPSGMYNRHQHLRYDFFSAERAITEDTLLDPLPLSPDHDKLLRIARDSAWLLQQHEVKTDLESIRRRYVNLLVERHLATYSGQVRVGDLVAEFLHFYSPNFLQQLHCELDLAIGDNWLLKLLRRGRSCLHPLQHLLLMQFLNHTAASFFALSPEFTPFGDGPWPCLNRASDHFQEPRIIEVQIIYNPERGGRIVGTFACDCGFIYSRLGPERESGNQIEIARMVAFGPIWEAELKRLWSLPAISLRELSRQLGVDPLTAKQHALQLGLSLPRPGGLTPYLNAVPLRVMTAPAKIDLSKRAQVRQAWLDAIKPQRQAGVKAIRESQPAVYAWLYRHDRTWLKQHSPRKKTVLISPPRVDWGERDQLLAPQVLLVAERLRQTAGRPKRISATSIGKALSSLALIQQHLDYLPLTRHALQAVVESREQYAIRRVEWTMGCYQREVLTPRRWQLIKRSGVERLMNQPVVKEALDKALGH